MQARGLHVSGPSVTQGETPSLAGLLGALEILQVAPERVPASWQALSLALIRLAERARSRTVYLFPISA